MQGSTGRNVGIGLVLLGSLFVVIGLVALIGNDAGEPAPAAESATTTSPAPATTTASGSTEASAATPGNATAPTTSAPEAPATTTTLLATTTTLVATSTAAPPTTIAPEDRIDAFVAAYAAATDADDVDFLYGSLHPGVIEVGGEELCRAYVAREIVEISNYRRTGPITGPTEILSGITGYRAEVTFDFMGQTFTDNAQFAFVDGVVRWFTSCR